MKHPPRRLTGPLLNLSLACAVLGNLAAAASSPLTDGGTYRLRNACAGLALDVAKAGLQDGAKVVVWPYAAAANQQWRLSEISRERYRLTAIQSGKVLDVSNSGKKSGTPVQQWRGVGGVNQEWLIKDAGGSQYHLTPVHAPELRLEVRGGAKQAGTAVQVSNAQDGCAQRWRIEQVAQPARTSRLGVSADGRSLTHADGSPFVYLADTAWELAHRLNREEVVRYLDTRRAQGFSVIQVVALAELGGPTVPNAQGDLPFVGKDPARPATTPGANPAKPGEYDYWDHLDFVISQAAARGLYVALLPTWGSWINDERLFTPTSARSYGRFLGERYRRQPVIWILGGDRNPDTDAQKKLWQAMAAGLEEGVGSKEAALISYHPAMPYTSSTWFHDQSWLDFNIWQTGHCRQQQVWAKIGQVYALKPVKPVLNAEPLYEDHPVCFDAGKQGYSDSTDVRNVAYWSIFAGAFGHTYGNHAVWQMYTKARKGVNGPLNSWQDALHSRGAEQMKYLRALMEARPMLGRVPDPSLLEQAYGGTDRAGALRGKDHALIYSASGKPLKVRLERLPGRSLVASWFDPRSGRSAAAGTYANKGSHTFTPPSHGRGNDWVLILDDASRNYPPVPAF